MRSLHRINYVLDHAVRQCTGPTILDEALKGLNEATSLFMLVSGLRPSAPAPRS